MLFASQAEKLAARMGVVLIPNWRAARLPEERHLLRLFKHLDVDCVFDVGANVGQYGAMLRDAVGYTGRIISFEPNPAALTDLERKAGADPNWMVERFALGANEGAATFHAYDDSALGSLREFGGSEHAPRRAGGSVIEVRVRTLESFYPEVKARLGFRRPFLKLDTQGYDVEVAKGAGGILTEFVGLQSELSFQTIYAGAPDYQTALSFYQDAGFVLSALVPIHEIHFPQLVEMDAILVRRDLARIDRH